MFLHDLMFGFSRSSDGRKVLRSTIREFLCSEAMHHLGIPSTRGGTVVTSDTLALRDMFYDGRPQREKCTLLLRIAPTFLRYCHRYVFLVIVVESFVSLMES